MNTRTFRMWPAVLLLAFLISACAPAEPGHRSSMPDETGISDAGAKEALTQRSLDYVAEIQKGNFSGVLSGADEELASRYTEEDLNELWTACLSDARDFKSQESPEVTALEEGYQVNVYSVHTKYRILSSFSFDKEGKLSDISFSLKPLIVQPEEGETWYEVPITLGYDVNKPLNGMLTLPKKTDKPPVAILVQGSGKGNMDSLIGAAGNRFFADLAHGLADLGVASIRYDKRYYAYPKDVIDIQTEYLYDVKDAVRFALKEERVNGEQLYLIGHSQGGMLSPKLASDNPEFKGFISMGGTLRRMEDLILKQNRVMNALNPSLTEEEREAADAAIASLVAEIKALDGGSDASPDALLYGYPETYWKSLNKIDSLALAKELAAEEYPMLILQGINDFQVLYDTDYVLWQEVTAGNPNAACIAYEGLSHVFMPGSPEFNGAVYDPPAHVEPAVIQDIAEWIERNG